jgi:hypothetical protein
MGPSAGLVPGWYPKNKGFWTILWIPSWNRLIGSIDALERCNGLVVWNQPATFPFKSDAQG